MVNKMQTRICATETRQAKRVRRRTHCRRHEPNDALRSIDRSIDSNRISSNRPRRSIASIDPCSKIPSLRSLSVVASGCSCSSTRDNSQRCIHRYTKERRAEKSVRVEYVRRLIAKERGTGNRFSFINDTVEKRVDARSSGPVGRGIQRSVVIRTAVERINISSTDFKLRLPAATRFQTLPRRLLMPVRE